MSNKNPFVLRRKSPLWTLAYPSSVGVLSGAILAAAPSYLQHIPDIRLGVFDGIPLLSKVPDRAYLAVVGFLLGLGTAKGCNWFRLWLLKRLLGYHGWMQSPKSFKTKIWGSLLKIMKGPRPFATFQFQPYLPKQPLPELDETLDKWLMASSQVLTSDDFEVTKEAVEEFRLNEGPVLQKFLKEKSECKDSWIYEYWLNCAYLANRQPVGVYTNYYVSMPLPEPVDQLSRAAVILSNSMRFAQRLDKTDIPPAELLDLVPLCMSGVRYVMNCTRIPGEYMDEVVRYPGKNHVIITRKGHFFKVDLYLRDSKGRVSVPTWEEVRTVLQDIIDEADNLADKPLPVAAFTGQARNVWAIQRKQLMAKNAVTLEDIESAMFVLDLEDKATKDMSKLAESVMVGDGNNRWFDKSMNMVVYEDGLTGINVEHSALDAMVLMTFTEYLMVNEKYENGLPMPPNNSKPRSMNKAERLVWDLTGLEENINTACQEFLQLGHDLKYNNITAPYSKGVIKKFKCSPDGFIQMAIQLAYYKLHKSVVKTYEPSTGRLYLLGRTETINPISPMSVAWLKAMGDPELTWQTRKELLKRAIQYQTSQRLNATEGKGCDRHLFALMCAARENGMDLPKVFMDKTWQDPYILSTSQTPTRARDIGAIADYRRCQGGFAPNCQNGYGISYGVHGDDILNLSISSWRSSEVCDSDKFGNALNEAMEEMKEILSM